MANNDEQIKSLLRRVEIFIEDKDVSKANEYCERILDIEPSNADAYKYKLFLDLGIEKEDEIFDKDYLKVVSNNNYQRYIKNLPEKERKNIEDKWNLIAYTIANNYLAANDLKNAKKIFESLGDYKDSNEKLQEINDLLENKSNETKEKVRKYKRIVIPVVAVLVLLIVIINTYFFKKFLIDVNINRGSYQIAIDSINKLDKEKRDSSEMTIRTNYCKGMINYEKANYGEAISYLEKAGAYADSVKKLKESRFLNAESKWKEGYLKDAYVEMKKIYNSDKTFKVNNKFAREYLVEWVKFKDWINLIGDFKIEKCESEITMTNGYSSSTTKKVSSDSTFFQTLECYKVINNTAYYKLRYVLPYDLLYNTADKLDLSYKSYKNAQREFDFSYNTTFLEVTHKIDEFLGRGRAEIAEITNGKVAHLLLVNLTSYRGADTIMTDLITATLEEKNLVIDTIDTFIDTSTYKEGFNDNMYKKSNGDLAKNEWVEDNGDWYYFNNDKMLEKNKWVGDFYVDADGKMLKDTTTPDGYLVDKDGKAVTNKIADDKTIYNDQGKIVKNGWVQINGSYYYTDSDGKYLSNTWVDGNNYYVGADGKMLKNTTTPDGGEVDVNGKKMITLRESIESVNIVSSYSENTLVEQMDTITFGAYPLSDKSGNLKEPIEWIVLKKETNKALLLSKYILDSKTYHDKQENTTWENCELRKWLNNDFYNEAFNNNEKNKISDDGGDRIFCINIEEAQKCFNSDENRLCSATRYARKETLSIGENSKSPYWLRSNQEYTKSATCISPMGYIAAVGGGFVDKRIGVRPAMWVKYK